MDMQKAKDLVHMLSWFVTTGQQSSANLLYILGDCFTKEREKRKLVV